LKGADHYAATMLPNVQVTSRRTRALGIFKGVGSAGSGIPSFLLIDVSDKPIRLLQAASAIP
jgi:hypothetical protein